MAQGITNLERQFEIRFALPSDASSLAKFAAEQFRTTYSTDTPESDLEAYISENFTPVKQCEEIESHRSRVVLAISREDIIGYSHVELDEGDTRSAFLNRIYVDPAWKGKSVGSALLAEVIANVRQQGKDRISLTVYEKNTRAVAFYKKSGFDVIGTDIFQVGDDKQTDFVMEKRLV